MANYCVYCGYETDNTWKYCPNCGKELPALNKKVIKNNEKILLSQNNNDFKIDILNNIDRQTHQRKIDRNILEGRLIEYRLTEKNRLNIPSYCIFKNSTIQAIVENRNNIFTKDDLYNIKGLGATSIDKYGNDIIDILNTLDQNYIPKK